MPQQFNKTADEADFYAFDFSDWLGSGETIADADVTISVSPSGLTIDDAFTNVDGLITIFVSAGISETGYAVTCHVKTSINREKDAVIYFAVK